MAANLNKSIFDSTECVGTLGTAEESAQVLVAARQKPN